MSSVSLPNENLVNLFENLKFKFTSVKKNNVIKIRETMDLSDSEKEIMKILMNELDKTVVNSDRSRNRSIEDGKTETTAEYETVNIPEVKTSSFDLVYAVKSEDLRGNSASSMDHQETSVGDVVDFGVAVTVNRPEKQSKSIGYRVNSLYRTKNQNASRNLLLSRFSRMVDVLDRPDGSVDEAFRTAVKFNGESVGSFDTVQCPFKNLVDDKALIKSVLMKLKCVHNPESCSGYY